MYLMYCIYVCVFKLVIVIIWKLHVGKQINGGISTKSFACDQIETSIYIYKKNEISLIPCFRSQCVCLIPQPNICSWNINFSGKRGFQTFLSFTLLKILALGLLCGGLQVKFTLRSTASVVGLLVIRDDWRSHYSTCYYIIIILT
jgi:hypothetical protein